LQFAFMRDMLDRTRGRRSNMAESSRIPTRRAFLEAAGAALLGTAAADRVAAAVDDVTPETHVATLFRSLTPEQRGVVAFPWDHRDPRRGLLRTFVANNWRITPPSVDSDFFSLDQKDLIRAIYEGLYSPEWVERIDAQLADDAGGWGRHQSIAIFGSPESDRFELVMTGRHLTIRCDGNTTEHVAFGGPIFYGHAADGFNEGPRHPGNVFWPQALEANRVFEMLDGAQRDRALVARRPREEEVGFRGEGPFPGIPIAELSPDQKEQVQRTLASLVEPYRAIDRAEVRECLDSQQGLERCSLAFYASHDIGDDGVWDDWRLEGPSFVWYFRGSPHVHVWVNVASDPGVVTNAG
jgi:hypothetical protein